MDEHFEQMVNLLTLQADLVVKNGLVVKCNDDPTMFGGVMSTERLSLMISTRRKWKKRVLAIADGHAVLYCDEDLKQFVEKDSDLRQEVESFHLEIVTE